MNQLVCSYTNIFKCRKSQSQVVFDYHFKYIVVIYTTCIIKQQFNSQRIHTAISRNCKASLQFHDAVEISETNVQLS